MKLLTCALIALALPVASAAASFPGRNGDLAVVSPFETVRHIVEVDPRTGDKDWLTGPFAGARETFAPEYFPDGRRLLFVQLEENYTFSLWSADKEGGNEERLARRIHMWRGANAPAPRLSSDGKRILYSRSGGIFSARLDGSDERALHPVPQCTRPDGSADPASCDFASDPTPSPDGRWITAMRNGGAVGDASGLWLMDARDGRPVRRLAGAAAQVDWSPDSRRIVFASVGGGGRAYGNIYSVRVDGRGTVKRHTRVRRANDIAPVWSPDGKWVAWVRVRPGPEEFGEPFELSVWRRRVAGGPATRMAKLPEPYSDSGFFDPPTLSWQPRP